MKKQRDIKSKILLVGVYWFGGQVYLLIVSREQLMPGNYYNIGDCTRLEDPCFLGPGLQSPRQIVRLNPPGLCTGLFNHWNPKPQADYPTP